MCRWCFVLLVKLMLPTTSIHQMALFFLSITSRWSVATAFVLFCSHIILSFVQATEADSTVEFAADSQHQDLQATIQSAIDHYVASHYHSEMSTGGVYSKDGRLSVVITGEKNNLKNFWSGKWSSTWALTVAGLSVRISGEIKVCCSA